MDPADLMDQRDAEQAQYEIALAEFEAERATRRGNRAQYKQVRLQATESEWDRLKRLGDRLGLPLSDLFARAVVRTYGAELRYQVGDDEVGVVRTASPLYTRNVGSVVVMPDSTKLYVLSTDSLGTRLGNAQEAVNAMTTLIAEVAVVAAKTVDAELRAGLLDLIAEISTRAAALANEGSA